MKASFLNYSGEHRANSWKGRKACIDGKLPLDPAPAAWLLSREVLVGVQSSC